MRKGLHVGLATVFFCGISFGFLVLNCEVYGLGLYLNEVSEVASIYGLENVLCALEINCGLQKFGLLSSPVFWMLSKQGDREKLKYVLNQRI
jgi:hypothetical protein